MFLPLKNCMLISLIFHQMSVFSLTPSGDRMSSLILYPLGLWAMNLERDKEVLVTEEGD
jgi:hypothetical protein